MIPSGIIAIQNKKMRVNKLTFDRCPFIVAVVIAAVFWGGILLRPQRVAGQTFMPQTPEAAKYEMLVMGDSIVWGQGLTEDQKFYTIVRNEITKRTGRIIKLVNRSHSGATIMPVDKTDLVEPGEVPLATPTLWQQFEAAIADYNCERHTGPDEKPSNPKYKCSGVDLVLLDGGINDVGVPRILSPFTSQKSIKKASHKYCYLRMKEFLQEVMATFENATVVVTGYYPMICAGQGGTDPNTIRDLILAYLGLGKKKTRKVEKNERARHDWLIDIMSEHAAVWKKASDEDLTAAVEDANKMAGGSRAVFVRADLATTECYNASETKLFRFMGIDDKGDPVTDDALLRERVETLCPKAKADMNAAPMAALRRFYLTSICKPAGTGHPNPNGAKMYAGAILARLGSRLPLAPTTQ